MAATVMASNSRPNRAADLLRQVEREIYADPGVAGVKVIRAAEKSGSTVGNKDNVPDSHFEIPPKSIVDRARQIGAGAIKGYSDAIESDDDVAFTDDHDIADVAGGTTQRMRRLTRHVMNLNSGWAGAKP